MTDQIEREVSELLDLERSYKKQFDADTYMKAVQTVERIKQMLGGHQDFYTTFKRQTQKVLRDIQTGKTFTQQFFEPYLDVFRKLGIDVKLDPSDLLPIDEREVGLDSLISVTEIARRRRDLGGVVTSRKAPEFVTRQLSSLKQSYILGLDSVAVVFCRALLEAALYDRLVRIGEFHSSGKIQPIESHRYNQIVRRACARGVLTDRAKQDAIGIGEAAGRILHSKNAQQDWEKTPLEIIKSTFRIVEHAFG